MQRECLGHNPTVVPHPLTDVTITLTPSAPGVAGVWVAGIPRAPYQWATPDRPLVLRCEDLAGGMVVAGNAKVDARGDQPVAYKLEITGTTLARKLLPTGVWQWFQDCQIYGDTPARVRRVVTPGGGVPRLNHQPVVTDDQGVLPVPLLVQPGVDLSAESIWLGDVYVAASHSLPWGLPWGDYVWVQEDGTEVVFRLDADHPDVPEGLDRGWSSSDFPPDPREAVQRGRIILGWIVPMRLHQWIEETGEVVYVCEDPPTPGWLHQIYIQWTGAERLTLVTSGSVVTGGIADSVNHSGTGRAILHPPEDSILVPGAPLEVRVGNLGSGTICALYAFVDILEPNRYAALGRPLVSDAAGLRTLEDAEVAAHTPSE